MSRQLYGQGGACTSNWRQGVQEVKQEVVQRGCASLPALCNCLDQFPGGSWSDLTMLAQDLALIGQQLHALCCQHTSTADALQTTQQQQRQPSLQQQQDQQQAVLLADVLSACIRFCKAVAEALAAVPKPHEQQRQHSRWHHSQRHRQQQQQQHVQQHLLPAAAATALCSCLRQWADPMLLPAACQHSPGLQETDLPQAAVVALGALLPSQLPIISAHERAAVLALLSALAQPPMHSSSTSTSTAGGSSSSAGTNTTAAAAGPCAGQNGQEQQHHMQDSQHWVLACKAVVALTDTMSEALRSSSAATAASGSGKQPAGSAAGPVGLQSEEAASIIAGLVEALSTSCGVRGGGSGSSSRGGSAGGAAAAAAGSYLASGTRSGSTGGSSGGAQVSSSRQQPVEGLVQSQYYASLLVALNHAVNSNKQGWQSHAGAITESARKLFTYGTQQQLQQQQQQQQGKEAKGSPAAPTAPAATAAVSSNGSPAAAFAQSTAPASQQPLKKKYVPPHARAAGAAAQSPSKQPQLQQQQWQESSDESEQSASDWSDVSDSEYFHGSSSRRASSSSRDSSQHKQQQQQQLHDPIKAVRVRSALLQLLQVLIQADPSALHPYWAALLPSQAPLQQTPLSPHLLTMLLYDPSDKVRLLAAAVLGALLEGPTARSLLAVAEAKTAHPTLRGFITMSVSLGHMLISLHTGLLAVMSVRQQQQQQQQQGALQVPLVLLTAVLRVLCALVPVTPYERLPSTLLTDLVDRVWQLWQVLQPQATVAAALHASPAQLGANSTAGVGVPRLALSAATAAGTGSAGAPMWTTTTSSSSSSSTTMVAVVAALAQALSTKKPVTALGRWLNSSSSSGGGGGSTSTSNNSNSSTSSRGPALISSLLAAAGAPDCLLRIEALAALRGCCINYPAAVPSVTQPLQTARVKAVLDSTGNVGSTSSSSSSGGEQARCWQQLLGVVGVSIAAAAQPASARSTPRSSPRVSDTADTPAAGGGGGGGGGGDGSGSTSPEVKAGQHAVRLLGDWLAAASNAGAAGDAGTDAGQQPQQQQQQQRQEGMSQLGTQWESILQLLLSDSVWHHPSPVLRSAAAAVAGMIPAQIWPVLPHALRQQLLAAAAGTAAGADVTAVRASACKLLGSCAVMPGVLGQQQQQQQQQTGDTEQQWPEQQIFQALAQSVSDEAVSVRLSAAWALANVCDELRRQLDEVPFATGCAGGPSDTAGSGASGDVQQQQQDEEEGVCIAPCGPVMGPAVLRLLCDAAVAAAGDTEKVRAHGVRAVGALLAAWQVLWGLGTASNSNSSSVHQSTAPAAAAAAAAAGAAQDWSWVPTWFKAAFGALQSCLAARSMKVVWNAACAAAAGLQNQHILTVSVVADSTPGLLRMLVVLVRDSSNYKIKTHAAAALAAPAERAAYGEVYGDVLLVVLAALQGLNSSSSSAAPVVGDGASGASSSSAAAAADGQQSSAGGADGLDDEGAFPNYRYIPGLQAQLEASLCHLLSLLQPSDSTRLREQLKRNQQLLLTALAKCAEPEGAANAGQQQGAGLAAGAGATGVVGGMGRGGEFGRVGKQQNVANGVDCSGASLPASSAVGSSDSSQQQEGVAGQAAMQQQQQQVKSALPVDPFGQGARQSADGSAVVTSSKGSAAAGTAGSDVGKAAAAGGGGFSTAGALGWCTANTGIGADAIGSKSVFGSYVVEAGSEGGVSVSEGVQAALKGLSAVLGPAVDAWTKQQLQV